MFAGASVAALIIGTTPIILAIIGNLRDRSVAWSRLAMPMALVAIGLVVLNAGAFNSIRVSGNPLHLSFGIGLAVVALIVWIFYAILNADSARAAPDISALDWSAFQGIGTLVSLIPVALVGWLAGWSALSEHALFSREAVPLWGWSVGTGLLSAFGATVLWTIAARRLPMALAGQLIVFEALFGMGFGLIAIGRAPTWFESVATLILISGVVWGVQLFANDQTLAKKPDLPDGETTRHSL